MEKIYRIKKDVAVGIFEGRSNGGPLKHWIGVSNGDLLPESGEWLTLAEAKKLRDRLTALLEKYAKSLEGSGIKPSKESAEGAYKPCPMCGAAAQVLQDELYFKGDGALSCSRVRCRIHKKWVRKDLWQSDKARAKAAKTDMWA